MNAQLGSMHAESFGKDPKHLAFVLARYHFVARMLHGVDRVLEIGCGDGTGARLVKEVVGQLVAIDIVDYADNAFPPLSRVRWDILDGPYESNFDAIYALDVLEHIARRDEDRFFRNVNDSLKPSGTVIIGSPSLESQLYASNLSKLHHINCKDGDEFRRTLRNYYGNVFVFGMNDCTLNCGYDAMVHYRLAIATNKR